MLFSARILARAAPRTLPRRLAAVAGSSILLRPQCSRPVRVQKWAFSTSFHAQKPSSPMDRELSTKLKSEIQFESEMKENEPQPVSIKDFLDNSPFKIQDTPGKQDVVLTRTFNNEKITVTFTIADLSSMENESFEDDSAIGDEEGSQPQEENAEDADEAGGESDANVNCRLNIVVEKPGKGALNIEAVTQDGGVVVENMYYYNDPALAHSFDADAVHKSRDAYPGPPFGTLDEDLQLLMEQYLDERGINSALATFVPDYLDVKEQREYLAWLNNVKKFVDA